MADVALTPTVFANQTLETAGSGSIPAAIGVLGAGLGLVALTPFLAPALRLKSRHSMNYCQESSKINNSYRSIVIAFSL